MDQKQDNVQPLLDEHIDKAPESLSKCHADASDTEEPEEVTHFNPPQPSLWKRAALIALVCLLLQLGLNMRGTLLRGKKPDIIYASRYSKQHQFRPAASPVVTETLKDGRTRIRGAYPTPTTIATPSSTAASKKRRRSAQAGRASGSRAKRKRSPSTAKQ